jgi:hypothetical protein
VIRGPRGTIAALGIAALGLASLALDLPLCPVATMLGVPCPGCGLGRATLAVARGDFSHALALHPLVLFVLSALALGAWRVVRGPTTGGGSRRDAWISALATLLLLALIGVWSARFFGAFGGPVSVAAPFWSPDARDESPHAD